MVQWERIWTVVIVENNYRKVNNVYILMLCLKFILNMNAIA